MNTSRQANHLDRGREAERIAGEFLQSHGYTVLERNFRCRQGEIDLIVRHEHTIYFVEVKGRWSDKYGRPLEQLSARQARRIRQAAEVYIRTKKMGEENRFRFSVLGVDASREPPEIQFVPDAFAG